MKNPTTTAIEQPTIVNYIEPHHNGIQSARLSRNALGYVLHGTKYIYTGDQCRKASEGCLFYLSAGHQYIENTPDEGRPFEQIIFYYTPDELKRIVLNLNLNYDLKISNQHACKECTGSSHAVVEGWRSLDHFFTTTAEYIHDEGFRRDRTAELIKFTELIYLIVSHGDSCLKNRLMSNLDEEDEEFEQAIYDSIFTGMSIEDLAAHTNRSVTAFKKEFQRHFKTPPHKWFITQRLNHAKLMLISTKKSVGEIGAECGYANTSHFIKLFRKECGMTPSGFRAEVAAHPHEAEWSTADETS